MVNSLKIALAQLDPVVGDIAGNADKARAARAEAARLGADLVVLSELFIVGYPPEDLVLRQAVQDTARAAVEALAAETADGGPAVLIGTPWREGDKLHNSVALLDGGAVRAVRHKVDLPNYSVFDEKRVFKPGPLPGPVDFRGVRIGVPICEDIWTPEVCECLEETGAELLLVSNGSPWSKSQVETRLNVVVGRVTETSLPMIYVNQVGGQDELVFDGGSFVLNADRTLALQLPAWQDSIVLSKWSRTDHGWVCEQGPVTALEEGHEAIYLACVRGLRDYVNKNRFPGVVLGLSGGIDSALCAAMAVDALGPDRVHCIMLPYRYTSEESLTDARACAEALGVRYDVLPIADPVEGLLSALAPVFDGVAPDVTEENIQSRVRGTMLMAVSNKFGPMVVTTGNKSEMSVGYATLYGDMNGGFNPIKDIYKTEVFELARFRNQVHPKASLGPAGRVIPENIIIRPPSAELREDQRDEDSLPPYAVLDDILRGLVEGEQSVAEIVTRGHDRATVERIQHLLYIAEYKRRQAAPGVKISGRNFGRDRRYPITNAFRERG
jgi:NAD+ synthase